MNTPAHAMLNLLILGRRGGHKKAACIVAGALIPDAVIVVMYLWHLALGTPESIIWSVEYYRPGWQAVIDIFNSIPLILLAIWLSWKKRSYLLLTFFASMLLHTLGDLPLHHEDAHRHFLPFTDWRFLSPVSYWNPAYYGDWVSRIEAAAVFAAAGWLYLKRPVLRVWVASIGGVYLLHWVYVILVWK